MNQRQVFDNADYKAIHWSINSWTVSISIISRRLITAAFIQSTQMMIMLHGGRSTLSHPNIQTIATWSGSR
jgi:hypothetical protein